MIKNLYQNLQIKHSGGFFSVVQLEHILLIWNPLTKRNTFFTLLQFFFSKELCNGNHFYTKGSNNHMTDSQKFFSCNQEIYPFFTTFLKKKISSRFNSIDIKKHATHHYCNHPKDENTNFLVLAIKKIVHKMITLYYQ